MTTQQQRTSKLWVLPLLSVMVLTSSLSADAQSRKIRQEDPNTLSSTPMPSTAVGEVTPVGTATTGTATGLGLATPGLNYISHDPGPVSTAPAIPYPPAPAANSTLPMLVQAIQAFMNYSQKVDEKGNPDKLADHVPSAEANAETRAPGYGAVTGTALDANCPALPAAAVAKMRAYLSRCGNNISAPSGNVSIVDFSTNAPVLYVLKKTDLSCVGSTRVTFGTGSHQTQPRAGNVPNSKMTPAGFHITKVHNGQKYQEWNSIGIQGMGTENNQSIPRGIILHPVRGTATWGCIGIPETRFATVKQQLGYGSVIYNYFPNQQQGDSEYRCPGASYSRRSVRSIDRRASSQGSSTTDAYPSEDEAGIR